MSKSRKTVYIFTLEIIEPFVDSMTNIAFERLMEILMKSLGILWLSYSSIINTKEPSYAQS